MNTRFDNISSVTGDGAYKISGGANGGWWSGFFSGISVGAVIAMIGLMMTEVLKVSVGLALFSGIFSTLVLGAYLLLVLAIVVTEIQLIYYSDEKLASCYWGGFGLGNAVGGLVPGQAYITSLINFILAFIFAKSVDSATYESCVK